MRGPLAGYFPLDQDVRTLQRNARVVEKTSKDVGRLPEGKIAHHPERSLRQRQRQEVRLRDPHPARGDPTGMIPEMAGPRRIRLDGDHVDSMACERKGDDATAGADLDDKLACMQIRFRYEAIREVGREEILAETTSPLVSERPPMGGHGRSP